MTLKAVFIDVGNTLLYEKPSRFEIYAEGARRRGCTVSTEAMKELMRRAHRELPSQVGGAFRYTDPWFEAYIERIFHRYLGLARSDLPGVHEELFGRFSRPETFALHAGGDELLLDLARRGLRIGIVSNWSTRLPALLERMGIARRVNFVLCSAIERAEKPDAAIFERALALAEVEPHEALHAGDDFEKDVLGARRVGIRAVLVDHSGAHASGEVPRVKDLFQLSELIARLTG
jgi:putative hydrolase of the HAD superfamily